MNYYINPHYTLENRDGRIVLYGEYKDAFAGFYFTEEFESIIHPFHAQILICFNGVENIQETISSVAEHFDVSHSKIESFILPLINNESKISIFFKSKELVFPEHLIIKSDEMLDTMPKYLIKDFEVKEINLNRARLSKPRSILYMPTYRCYANCIYCFEDRWHINAKKTLPIEKVIALIEEAKHLGVSKFEVMGGDNFCYPEWHKMYQKLKEVGYTFLTSTKYPLNEEDISKLKDLGTERIQFSLDSLVLSTIPSLLRISEKYADKVKQTLDLFEKYDIKVDIHTILTRVNCNPHDLLSIYSFIRSKKNIREWRIDQVYASYFSEFNYDQMAPTVKQYKEIESTLMDIEKDNNSFSFVYDLYSLEGKKDLANDKRTHFFDIESVKCPANHSQMTILPDGQVTICSKLHWTPDFLIGDVNRTSLYDIWNSSKAIHLASRKNFIDEKSKCFGCPDLDFCDHNASVCYMNVLAAYGPSHYNYPDPKCPYAPDPILEGYSI